MLIFTARQAGRLFIGVLGAIVLAAAVSAAASSRHHGFMAFIKAAGARALAYSQLEFGTSALSGQSVLGDLQACLPITLYLVAAGAVIGLLLGVPLGLLFVSGPVRRAAAPAIQIVTAAPVFCAGLALAYGGHLFGWPVTVNAPAVPTLQAAAMPVVTVGLAGAAAVQLALRRAATRSAEEPYRVGLRRMGLSFWDVELLYGIPQILAGLAAAAGEITAMLLSAAVVAEWVFHLPGAADLFVKSVALEDWNVAAPILLVFAAITFVGDTLGQFVSRILMSESGR